MIIIVEPSLPKNNVEGEAYYAENDSSNSKGIYIKTSRTTDRAFTIVIGDPSGGIPSVS